MVVARITSKPKRRAPKCFSVNDATSGNGSQTSPRSPPSLPPSPVLLKTSTALLARKLGRSSSTPSSPLSAAAAPAAADSFSFTFSSVSFSERITGSIPAEKSNRVCDLKW